MNTRFALIAFLTLPFVSGCVSQRTARTADTALTTAAAGAVGYLASDGNVAIGVGSATAAFAAKQYAANVADKKQREQVELAYAAGEAKATRDLYEAIQRNQSVDTTSTDSQTDDATYLPVAAPRRKVNGVIIEPTIEYIRINDGTSP